MIKGNDATSSFHFWGFEVDEADKVDSIWGYLLYYTQAGKECRQTHMGQRKSTYTP